MHGASPPHVTRSFARRSRLVRYLVVGYTLLIGYASLYPFATWHGAPEGPFRFLLAAWPPYYTFSDLFLNVLGYLPLGFLLALAILPLAGAGVTSGVATALSALLSLGLEVAQHFTPARVPSNVDVLTNGLGALLGAVLAVTLGGRWLLTGHLYRVRQRVFRAGSLIDWGFVLLLAWLFTQLNPEVWLFGNGDMRSLWQASTNVEFNPWSYRWLETGVTAFNLAAICLLTASLARPGQSVAGSLLALVSAALCLKSAAAMTLFKPGNAALWLTPGSMLGIPAGLLLYLSLNRAPRPWRPALAALLLAAGVVLLNIAPENPYFAAALATWRHGHFLSFNGLTELTSVLWPLVACAYLAWLMLASRPVRSL
jgi:VanZ family protein